MVTEMREVRDVYCFTQQECASKRGNSRLLLGMQSSLWTDGTTKKTRLVLDVFSSLIDVNICSMSFPLHRARGSEIL